MVCKVVFFSKKPEVVANLTWIDFIELFVERLTPEYQELHEKMNLVEMRHTWSLKAYVSNFNTQMNVTSKMGGGYLFHVSIALTHAEDYQKN